MPATPLRALLFTLASVVFAGAAEAQRPPPIRPAPRPASPSPAVTVSPGAEAAMQSGNIVSTRLAALETAVQRLNRQVDSLRAENAGLRSELSTQKTAQLAAFQRMTDDEAQFQTLRGAYQNHTHTMPINSMARRISWPAGSQPSMSDGYRIPLFTTDHPILSKPVLAPSP